MPRARKKPSAPESVVAFLLDNRAASALSLQHHHNVGSGVQGYERDGESAEGGVTWPGVWRRAAAGKGGALLSCVPAAAPSKPSATAKLAAGFVMSTSCRPERGASKFFTAKEKSSALFQVAMPPERTPHIG